MASICDGKNSHEYRSISDSTNGVQELLAPSGSTARTLVRENLESRLLTRRAGIHSSGPAARAVLARSSAASRSSCSRRILPLLSDSRTSAPSADLISRGRPGALVTGGETGGRREPTTVEGCRRVQYRFNLGHLSRWKQSLAIVCSKMDKCIGYPRPVFRGTVVRAHVLEQFTDQGEIVVVSPRADVSYVQRRRGDPEVVQVSHCVGVPDPANEGISHGTPKLQGQLPSQL